MKILLTGGTGFLGKQVLQRLVEDERVREIIVMTRRKRHHQSPKVRVLVHDLAGESALPDEIPLADINHVIHLAGLYDFGASHESCYEQNVLGTMRLLWLLRDLGSRAAIHFTSTYAVGCPDETVLHEAPLERLPSPEFPYAYSKALCERLLQESGLPSRIFRLGILIGDSRNGAIEKIDGVYAYLELLRRISRLHPSGALLKRAPLPIPADPGTLLPLVPVDTAAEVLAASPFQGIISGTEFYGVFNPSSASVGEIVNAAHERLLPGAKAAYLKSRIPAKLLSLQEKLSGVPATTFRYANHHTRLESLRFAEKFPSHPIPGFSLIKDCWLRGFEDFMELSHD